MEKLAIEGGEPVRSAPFSARILFGQEEKRVLLRLLEREMEEGGGFDRYSGTEVDAFEEEFAAHFCRPYATATSSGTGAIHAALGALRLEPGSEVISSPITDPGGVAPILWNNCIPVFADADPETFNVDPASVAERISDRTRAIVVAHIAGQPCDMDPIMDLAEVHDLTVIEDCAQAHEAEYKGRKAGTIGHVAAFSMMSGKHFTSGGQGGMVVTDDEEIYWNAKRFADRGKPFNSEATGNLFLGLNYRMTEIEAAIGRVQLKKLSGIVEKRRGLVASLEERMADLEAVHLGKVIEGARPSYWFLLIRVEDEKLSVSKDEYAEAVAAEGMPVAARYDFLMYETPWIRDRQTYGQSGCPWTCPLYGREIEYEGSCPGAREAIEHHMVLHLHEGFGEQEIEDIASALQKVERHYRWWDAE
ncbi:MAG: DegT/DnrJ/EryC1/StrS family aminotransferase [Anaerolineae bacterium]